MWGRFTSYKKIEVKSSQDMLHLISKFYNDHSVFILLARHTHKIACIGPLKTSMKAINYFVNRCLTGFWIRSGAMMRNMMRNPEIKTICLDFDWNLGTRSSIQHQIWCTPLCQKFLLKVSEVDNGKFSFIFMQYF